ncbi:unnamed protein product, partial [Prorocentrum cordatum]
MADKEALHASAPTPPDAERRPPTTASADAISAALKRTATQPDAQVRAQQLGAGRAGAHGRCCPAREARWPATGAARGLGPPPGRDPPAARRSPPPPRGPTRA